MTADQAFLGSGWSFPPTFDRRSGLRMTVGIEDIERSLEIIFSTALGERWMNPKFGCALDGLQFEPMNQSLLTYVQSLVETAILYHEPRIDAERVEVVADQLEGVLMIHVDYSVRTSNSRFNFVYPYYLDARS